MDGRVQGGGGVAASNREVMSDASYDLSVGLFVSGCVREAALEHFHRDGKAVRALRRETSPKQRHRHYHHQKDHRHDRYDPTPQQQQKYNSAPAAPPAAAARTATLRKSQTTPSPPSPHRHFRPRPLYLIYLYSPLSDRDAESKELRNKFVASVKAWTSDDDDDDDNDDDDNNGADGFGDDNDKGFEETETTDEKHEGDPSSTSSAHFPSVVIEELTPAALSMEPGSVQSKNRSTAKLRIVDYALANHQEDDVRNEGHIQLLLFLFR